MDRSGTGLNAHVHFGKAFCCTQNSDCFSISLLLILMREKAIRNYAPSLFIELFQMISFTF